MLDHQSRCDLVRVNQFVHKLILNLVRSGSGIVVVNLLECNANVGTKKLGSTYIDIDTVSAVDGTLLTGERPELVRYPVLMDAE